MLFVVDKPRFQRMIAIVRDDRTRRAQGCHGPFLRLQAADNQLALRGRRAEAVFPATVYEPGVLFLRVTIFRRLLGALREQDQGTRHLTVQVMQDGMAFAGIRLGFDVGDMLLYPDVATAPDEHPVFQLVPEDEWERESDRQGRLFESL